MTSTPSVNFNPDDWYKTKSQNRHEVHNNMVTAIDMALRWKQNSGIKMPRRLIVRYRLLLLESMRYFHIHDIPLPLDETTTVHEVCLEKNSFNNFNIHNKRTDMQLWLMIILMKRSMMQSLPLSLGEGANLVSKQRNCIHDNAFIDATSSANNNIPNSSIKHRWLGRPPMD